MISKKVRSQIKFKVLKSLFENPMQTHHIPVQLDHVKPTKNLIRLNLQSFLSNWRNKIKLLVILIVGHCNGKNIHVIGIGDIVKDEGWNYGTFFAIFRRWDDSDLSTCVRSGSVWDKVVLDNKISKIYLSS